MPFELPQVSPRKTGWAVTAVLGVLTLLAFGASRSYDYLEYDARPYLFQDYAIRTLAWDNIVYVFQSYVFVMYHPLQRISYMLDWAMWGDIPEGFRGTNFLLHWIAAVFVFLFFRKLTDQPVVAWFTALVFTIHPTRVEAVVWLAQRKDVLSAAFGFAALWAYQCAKRPLSSSPSDELTTAEPSVHTAFPYSPGWYGLSLLLVTGALASKAQWLPVCAILVLIDVYERRKFTLPVVLAYLPFAGVCAIFGWYAFDAQITQRGLTQHTSLSLAEYLSHPIGDIVFYCKQTVWPVSLLPRHPRIPPGPWVLTLGAVLVVVAAIASLVSWKQKRIVLFGIGWFVCFLSPMLNLVPSTLLPSDRFLYVAIVGLLFPAAMWLSYRSNQIQLSVTAVLLIGMLTLTWRYLPIWQNDLTLWTYITQHSEADQLALGNLMKAQVDAGQYQKARQTYDRAMARPDRYLRIFEVASILEGKTGGDAGAPLLLGIQTTRYSGPLVARYGKHFLAKRNYPEAEKWLTQAYTMDFGADTSLELADLYVQTGQLEKALPYTIAALETNPFQPEAWRILGILKLRTANQQAQSGKGTDAQATVVEAAQMLQLSLQYNPDQAEPQIGLARVALQQKNLAEAEKWMREIPVGRIPKARIPADGYLVWADIYRQQNQPFAALGALIEATQVEDAPQYWLELARLQVSMRRDARPALEHGFKQLDAKSQLELEQDPALGPLVKELLPKVEKPGQLPQSK